MKKTYNYKNKNKLFNKYNNKNNNIHLNKIYNITNKKSKTQN